MSDGQISVDLRLALEKLKDDIARASKLIKGGLSKSLNLGGPAGSPGAAIKGAGKNMEELNAKVKRVNSSLKDQLEAWKKLNAGGIAPGMKISMGPGKTGTPLPSGPRPSVPLTGGGLATPAPYSGPTPPVIAPPVIKPPMPGGLSGWAAKGKGILGSVFSGFSKLTGIVGKTLATLYLLERAFGRIVAPFTQSVSRAAMLYSKSLQSGVGLGYTTRRSNLASVLGVDEMQVNHFGTALGVLGPKLQWASSVMAKSTPALTSVSWAFGVLGKNVEALFMKISADFSPAIAAIADGVSDFVKMLGGLYDYLAPKLTALRGLMGFFVGLPLGPMGTGIMGARSANASRSVAPAPTAFMKQMPVSTLERMGLVVGGAVSGRNHAAETAQNTKKTYESVKDLANAIRSGYKNPVINTSQSYI